MARKKTKQPLSLSDQLRSIIESHELSRYRICKETGIDAGQLTRFMQGTTGLTIDKLDTLGECLNLEIRIKGE